MLTGRRRNELNTLTDCPVYAGFTAVGFAWLENIFIASGESLGASLATAVVRLVIGPFAHPLFTTMTGIRGVLRAEEAQRGRQGGAILLGYLGAVVMHALWNGSAVLGSSTYLSVYVLWMMPVFALAIVLAIKSRRREGQIIAAKLPGMISAGLLTPVEASWVAALPARKAAVRSARQFGGRAAASSVKRFIIQVVELGYVRDRIDRGFGDERVFALQNEEVQGVVAARARRLGRRWRGSPGTASQCTGAGFLLDECAQNRPDSPLGRGTLRALAAVRNPHRSAGGSATTSAGWPSQHGAHSPGGPARARSSREPVRDLVVGFGTDIATAALSSCGESRAPGSCSPSEPTAPERSLLASARKGTPTRCSKGNFASPRGKASAPQSPR